MERDIYWCSAMMRLLLFFATASAILEYCIVSASYRHTMYHSKGKKCYQCAWSPPKVAYATVKKPISYGSRPSIYGKSLTSSVNYGLKKVPVKVQGGWDKCHDPFTKYQADKFGIDQWECEHNCYTRTDKNGNLYRGCYKGEYNVNPKKLGCHYQAGSLYCFCAGELCNNEETPLHQYYQNAKSNAYISYVPTSPKSNYGVIAYDYNPSRYVRPKYNYRYHAMPFVRAFDYGYLRRPLSYKKARLLNGYDVEAKYNLEDKDKHAAYNRYFPYGNFEKYGKYDKYDKYDGYTRLEKYGKPKRKNYDNLEYDGKFRPHMKDTSSKLDYEGKFRPHMKDTSSKLDYEGKFRPNMKDTSSESDYEKAEDTEYRDYDSEEYGPYELPKTKEYDSYEEGKKSYERGYNKRYRKPMKRKYGTSYTKADRYSDKAKGDYRKNAYRYGSRFKRPMKHYIHPIKVIPLNKHR